MKADSSGSFDGWLAGLMENVNSLYLLAANSSNFTHCNQTSKSKNESDFCAGGMDDWPEEKFAWMSPTGHGKLNLS